jgi:rRNA-processing protein FCF1
MLTNRIARDTVSLSNRITALNNSSTNALKDTATALRAKILLDSNALATNINTKLNIADTSSMLSPYARTAATTSSLATKLNIADTSAMLTNRFARDTVSLSNRINTLNAGSTNALKDTATALRAKILLDSNALATNINTKLNIADTSSMLSPYARVAETTRREVADEFTATAAQTSFTLTQTPVANSKVQMFINGVRIDKTAYTVSTRTITYNPTNNSGFTLIAGDRIQFDYEY